MTHGEFWHDGEVPIEQHPPSLDGMMEIIDVWANKGIGMAKDSRVRGYSVYMHQEVPQNLKLQELLTGFLDYHNDPYVWLDKPEPHPRTNYQAVNHFLRTLHHAGMIIEQSASAQ